MINALKRKGMRELRIKEYLTRNRKDELGNVTAMNMMYMID